MNRLSAGCVSAMRKYFLYLGTPKGRNFSIMVTMLLMAHAMIALAAGRVIHGFLLALASAIFVEICELSERRQ